MATNLSIDPELVQRALEVSGERKGSRSDQGVAGIVARRGQKRLLELMGKLEWDAGFNYKAERERH